MPGHAAAAVPQSGVPADTISINSATVRGSRTISPLSASSSTVSVVSREMIAGSRESSLFSTLPAYVPGLFVTERGTIGFGVYSGAAGSITMRGVGASPNTQVLVTIDGQPQFMGINGHPLPDALRSSDAEKVEVIRGPGSTIYGSNAMGGVINIITRQPQEGVRTGVEASHGSYNTQKYLIDNSIRKGKFSSSASVAHDRTDGHRPFSKFELTSANLRLGYDISQHYKISAGASLVKFRSTDPGTVEAPSEDDSKKADVLRIMSSLAIENNYEKVGGALRLFFNYGDHDLYYGWRSDDYSFGAKLHQAMNLFGGNTITAGIDYNRYGGKATDSSKPAFALDKFIDNAAAYVVMEQVLARKLVFNAGLRYDWNSHTRGELVPQGSVTYRATRSSSFRLSVAKGYRNPTLRELYIFAPNDSLKPESMVNYELSYTLSKGRFQAEASVYIADGGNMIETEMAGGIPRKNYNSGSFRNTGFEIGASYRFAGRGRVAANYSYVYMEKPVLAAPRQMLNLMAEYGIGRFSLRGHMQLIDHLYTRTGNSPATDTFNLLDLSAGFRAAKWAEVYVKAGNILDQKYEMNYGYPMPGFTFTGGVRFSF